MHDRLTLDMDAPSRAIGASRVLSIHGSADATIPVEDAHSFHERIRGSELLVVEGACHNYRCGAHGGLW
jgi:pimeloyl-ACP methyl ester carboxylesterase